MTGQNDRIRNVLITGGSRGIGRAITLAAAAAGAETIVVNYLQNDTEAQRTKTLCEAHGTKCILHRANVLSSGDIDGLFDAVQAEPGTLDLFVHCAALNTFKPITAVKQNQWDLTMGIAARAFLLCAQKCIPIMQHGSMIALSSLGARRVLDNYGALGPSKAALESVVQYLACELAPSGIRVNGVTAGFVETESIRKFPHAAELIAAAVAQTPAGRIAQPSDVADVVLFLASSAARWIYGQTLVADGGLSLR
jgi:enoyl-[acyl-carrier protein] reductase III